MATAAELVRLSAVAGVGGAAAVLDLRTGRIPNGLTLPSALVGLMVAALGATDVSLASAVGGVVLGGLFILPGYARGATGGGDLKLLAALGAFLGAQRVVAAFCLTAIAGGVIALEVARRRGRLAATFRGTLDIARSPRGSRNSASTDHNRFRYGPAIALGCLIAGCLS